MTLLAAPSLRRSAMTLASRIREATTLVLLTETTASSSWSVARKRSRPAPTIGSMTSSDSSALIEKSLTCRRRSTEEWMSTK